VDLDQSIEGLSISFDRPADQGLLTQLYRHHEKEGA
jgi:hypothetical protein